MTTSGSDSNGGGCSHSEDRLWGAVEILPQRLYYAPLRFFPPDEIMEEDEYENGTTTSSTGSSSKSKQSKQQQMKKTTTKNKKKKPIHYFSIDNEFVYWNFFLDFGPLNLGHLYRFCALLHSKLNSPAYRNHIICYYSGAEGARRANATYLICAYQMLCLGRTLEESYFGFEPEEEGSGGREEDEDKRSGRRHRIRNSRGGGGGGWSNAAMAAVTNSDESEELLSNVSLPPQHKRLYEQLHHPQHRRHFPHRLTNSGGGGGGSSSGKSASQSTTKSPFAPIHPLPPYHDASPIICTYDLSVYDCLAGLEKARQFAFFDFGNKITAPPGSTTAATTDDDNNDEDLDTAASSSITPSSLFDINEYEHYEQVENGDLNWIIANKICAFAGPLTKKNTPSSDNNATNEGMYYNLTPADYIPYFQKRNVQLVIRLNNASCYDAQEFIDAGIQHVTHYYMDGSCPTMEILHNVVSDMEGVINRGEMMEFDEEVEEKDGSMDEAEDDMKQHMDHASMQVGKQRRGCGGAVAVHCKAGLGRTGTCIGAYIMKHYKFTAAEIIGYMRICRPGMVIGPQQHFLASIESIMWQEGDVYRMNIERLRGIAVYAEEVDGDNGGLRKMSIDSINGGDKEGEEGGRRMQQHTTPRAKASSGSAVGGGVGGGAHVTIVTPDGQPFRLLTTPVNARKIHIDSSNIDPSSSATNNCRKVNDYLMDSSSPAMLQPRPVPLSTKMEASTANHSNGSSGHQLIDIDFANDNMQEGDQANELLSRRNNRQQVRH
ncbi:hypothetical protein ACHAXH_001194 [Discostella pseudostelligera]